MSEEESFADSVWIELSIRILVMKSVISAPMEDWSLIGPYDEMKNVPEFKIIIMAFHKLVAL